MLLVISRAMLTVIPTTLETTTQSENRVMEETIRPLTVLGDVIHLAKSMTTTLRVAMRLGSLVRICHLGI
jgi:hypothetical protein